MRAATPLSLNDIKIEYYDMINARNLTGILCCYPSQKEKGNPSLLLQQNPKVISEESLCPHLVLGRSLKRVAP